MRRAGFTQQEVFPAHAGMSRALPCCDLFRSGFPRPRGDEPNRSGRYEARYTFSPPTRG